MADLIGRNCNEKLPASYQNCEVYVALDCALFMQHSVHSEFSEVKQITSTVRFDTEEALAADVSDIAIAFKVVSSDEAGSDLAVFTVKKKIISDVLIALQSNNIDPVSIEPDVSCLSRFLETNVGLPEGVNPFYGILSSGSGYFIIPNVSGSQKDKALGSSQMRTFIVGAAQNRNDLLCREVPVTIAMVQSEEPVNGLRVFDSNGSVDYPGVGERTGAEVRTMSDKVGVISENDLVWTDTPEGIWYRKIPYLWPINSPNTWLLNVAKFKAHSMGLTLCAKNLQGSIALNYQAHCTAYSARMDMDYTNHKNPTALADIKENYLRHHADGIPRWDRPGSNTWNSGIGMETWASRCIDNNKAQPAGLHILEGIYGVDGHFWSGPHPAGNENNPNGESWEYMSNFIIFGLNAYNIDNIGHWLGGHEPGNIGLFHIAIENGLSRNLNPMNIPLYEWNADGSANRGNLTDFEKTPLLTYYMRRDYIGDEPLEDHWHLVNEPYDYPAPAKIELPEKPEVVVLNQNFPNPFNPATSIGFSVPYGGNVRIEIYNTSGQLVEVLVNGYRRTGSHMAVWNTSNHPSGTYFYRLLSGEFSETKKMVLLK